MLITTPAAQLGHAIGRLFDLFRPAANLDRAEVIDAFVAYARLTRSKGLLSIEERAQRENDPFLREVLLLSLDVSSRSDLQSAIENKSASMRDRAKRMPKSWRSPAASRLPWESSAPSSA